MPRELSKLRDKMPEEAQQLWGLYTGIRWLSPDLVIAPDNRPYLYRWYVAGARGTPRLMFHIQVCSDPERPLHDHPWDNMSVILAGGYTEVIQDEPPTGPVSTYKRKAGDTIYRKAAAAHRLILPRRLSYTMTLFSTGPRVRDWGFWYPDGWHPHKWHVETLNGRSVHVNR